MGLDFVAAPGATVVAPCPCVVSHVGLAYANVDLASLHLDGIGEFADFRLKLLYTAPAVDAVVGAVFAVGDFLGHAQAVAGYWQAQHPGRGPMTNHVHEEVRVNDVVVDPAVYTIFPKSDTGGIQGGA